MNLSKMKALGFIAILLLLFLHVSVGRPAAQQSMQKIPKFLTQLYKRLSKGHVKLRRGVTAVYGIFAHVKQLNGAETRGTDVELSTNFAGTPFVKKTVKTDLYLQIESRSTKSRPNLGRALCKLYITDIKTNGLITSRQIPCDHPSMQVVTLTSFLNKWLKRPTSNFGVRVKISSNRAKLPKSFLPFINLSKQTEQPYYILYT